MPTFSIRTTLGLVIGVLGIMLVAISAISLNQAIQRYYAAQKVATLAPISQAFFRSLQQHRLERGNIMIAFRADAPASKDSIDNISAQRDSTKDGYNTGYALLSATRDLPGAAPILTKLKSAQDAVEAMRPKMMALIAQPKDQRDAQAMQEWPRVTQGYLPRSADRSAGPMKMPSTPSTLAISGMRFSAAAVSTCTITPISLSARA